MNMHAQKRSIRFDRCSHVDGGCQYGPRSLRVAVATRRAGGFGASLKSGSESRSLWFPRVHRCGERRQAGGGSFCASNFLLVRLGRRIICCCVCARGVQSARSTAAAVAAVEWEVLKGKRKEKKSTFALWRDGGWSETVQLLMVWLTVYVLKFSRSLSRETHFRACILSISLPLNFIWNGWRI